MLEKVMVMTKMMTFIFKDNQLSMGMMMKMQSDDDGEVMVVIANIINRPFDCE